MDKFYTRWWQEASALPRLGRLLTAATTMILVPFRELRFLTIASESQTTIWSWATPPCRAPTNWTRSYSSSTGTFFPFRFPYRRPSQQVQCRQSSTTRSFPRGRSWLLAAACFDEQENFLIPSRGLPSRKEQQYFGTSVLCQLASALATSSSSRCKEFAFV